VFKFYWEHEGNHVWSKELLMPICFQITMFP
jgi:hypothetical protein